MKNLFSKNSDSYAFTMAEILISLTIIGVIAAITLPALRANINERTWATQKKALFSRMSQAVALLDSTNSYASAQAFITEGLNDVLKINNICAGTDLQDCGIKSDQYIDVGGNNHGVFPGGWSALGMNGISAINASDANGSTINNTDLIGAFETQNGESIVLYYNPDCVPDDDETPTAADQLFEQFKYVCANMIYDLNQEKGPNTVGKDIGFMTVFYASDPVVVSPIPGPKNGSACSDNERIPTINEAVSLALNTSMIGNLTTGTGSISAINTSGRAINGTTTYYFTVEAIDSGKNINAKSSATAISNGNRCVKR